MKIDWPIWVSCFYPFVLMGCSYLMYRFWFKAEMQKDGYEALIVIGIINIVLGIILNFDLLVNAGECQLFMLCFYLWFIRKTLRW